MEQATTLKHLNVLGDDNTGNQTLQHNVEKGVFRGVPKYSIKENSSGRNIRFRNQA